MTKEDYFEFLLDLIYTNKKATKDFNKLPDLSHDIRYLSCEMESILDSHGISYEYEYDEEDYYYLTRHEDDYA